MRVNVISVIFGILGAIVGISLFEIIVWEISLIYISIPLWVSDVVYSESGTLLIDSIGLLIGMILGGYITGRIAKVDALYNGFVMGFVSVAVSVLLTAIEASTYSYLQIEYTLSDAENMQFFFDSVISVTGAMIGAHLSLKRHT